MKNLLLIVIGAFIALPVFAQTDIARIKEKNSNRELVYSRTKTEMFFTLKQGEFESVIKKLEVRSNGQTITVTGGREPYRFEIISNAAAISGDSYHWCWSGDQDVDNIPLALYAFPITLPLCTVVPAVPFLVGALLLPVDALITLGDLTLSKEAFASRKFTKLLIGKESKASMKVFNELLKEISKL